MFAFDRNNILCDIVVVYKDKKISAHKNVLVSHSRYFYRNLINKSSGPQFVLQSDERFSAKTLELIINYMYTSKLLIDKNNVKVMYIIRKTYI